MQRKPRVSSVDIKKFVGICLLFLIFVASTMAIVRAQTYSFSAQWGSQGSADGQFNSPFDIAVGKSGNIYVADSGNNRIQKFDSNGNFLSTWSKGHYEGVAVDESGNVYVCGILGFIQKFSLSYSPSASSSSSPVLTPTSSPKVPEYSTITLLLLFTTATMLLVEVSKRRKWTKT